MILEVERKREEQLLYERQIRWYFKLIARMMKISCDKNSFSVF